MDDYVPKVILVLGGSGFIFSNFLNIMVKKYPEILFINYDTLDKRSSLPNNIIVGNEPNYKFYNGNICHLDFVYNTIMENNVDTIILAAAYTDVDMSFNESFLYTKNNIYGCHTVLEAVKRYNKIKRFIYVSTDEVYGSCYDNTIPKKETDILDPTNIYSASKAGAEYICKTYEKCFHIPLIITRSNNVIGPRQYPTKIIPKFTKLIINNEKMTIHGNGLNKRNYIYVDDIVKAFDIIIRNGKIGETYNIGCNNEFTILQVARKIYDTIKPNREFEDCIDFIVDRPFNDFNYKIDSSKLLSLGWEGSTVTFDEGIQRTVEWCLEYF